MFQTKTFLAFLGMAALLVGLLPLQADVAKSANATQLRLNGAGDLEIIDSKGQLVKALSNGSISQSVKADNQAFKVSYGKDLRGRYTTIVYPDPEKPQTLSLSIFNQNVIVSSDAVLTMVTEKDMSTATIQSGVLGKISVAGNDLSGGNSIQIQNGTVVAQAAPAPTVKTAGATPAPSVAPAKTVKAAPAPSVKAAPAPVVASAPAPEPKKSGPSTLSAVPANYDGAHPRKVEGDVMIAPKGQDVVEIIKSSPIPPRLVLGDAVEPGSTIQTGPTGVAYVAPFPGAIMMIEPNSTVEFEKLEWRNNSGQVEHAMTANVKQGSVISAIKGIKPEELDYKVKTPHGVAAARGTVYITSTTNSNTKVVVSDGTVQVVTAAGTFTIGVSSGNQLTFTPTGTETPGPIAANADQITKLENFLAAVNGIIAMNDWGSAVEGNGEAGAPAPALDSLIDSFQRTFGPDLTPAQMTPTTS